MIYITGTTQLGLSHERDSVERTSVVVGVNAAENELTTRNGIGGAVQVECKDRLIHQTLLNHAGEHRGSTGDSNGRPAESENTLHMSEFVEKARGIVGRERGRETQRQIWQPRK